MSITQDVPSIRPRIGIAIIVIGALLALAAADTPSAPPIVGHTSSAAAPEPAVTP